MNRRLHPSLNYLLLSLSLALCACGGSSGSSTSLSGIDGSGAPVVAGTVSTTGAINGFGSVIVNGVHYNSDKANILINGETSSELNLRAGYQVKITGSIAKDGTATADKIEFRPDLLGTITAIDLNTQQLSLLGRQVQVSASTLFDSAISPNYLNGLAVGDSVLISGAVDDQGIINATRIERSTPAQQQISGSIAQLNTANRSLVIAGTNVDYSTAELLEVDNKGLQLGDKVSIYGQFEAASGSFKATKVIRLNQSLDTSIKLADLEGFIGSVLAANEFKLLGLLCKTTATTQFENGTLADLRLGAAVRLTGAVNSQGEVVVQKLEFKKISNNEIVGEVSNITLVNPTGNLAAVVTGSLMINNTTIVTTAKTLFEDNSRDLLHRFNFSSIRIKDFLKVSGFTNDQGLFIAVKIQRDELKTDDLSVLQFNGLISAAQAPSFTLFEQTIYTDSNTEIRNFSGQILSEADFYAQANGKRVAVQGTLINGKFTATSIRLAFGKEMGFETTDDLLANAPQFDADSSVAKSQSDFLESQKSSAKSQSVKSESSSSSSSHSQTSSTSFGPALQSIASSSGVSAKP